MVLMGPILVVVVFVDVGGGSRSVDAGATTPALRLWIMLKMFLIVVSMNVLYDSSPLGVLIWAWSMSVVFALHDPLTGSTSLLLARLVMVSASIVSISGFSALSSAAGSLSSDAGLGNGVRFESWATEGSAHTCSSIRSRVQQ